MSLRNHGGREVVKVLTRHGFIADRQRGSHIVLSHGDGRHVTVPRHEPIKEGVLKSIQEQQASPERTFCVSCNGRPERKKLLILTSTQPIS